MPQRQVWSVDLLAGGTALQVQAGPARPQEVA
jgi:hypothetical protein